ncbi:MAG: enoyl-CoA hydratase/isomerase family protein [Planctomycetes bacterium]|nr:enoyl-CoA hydratase/isomerase family protein [Planctomycetota bacterium]
MPTALPLTVDESGPFAGIYTLTLEQPGKPVVVLDQALIRDIETAVSRVPRSARGLVLRSASERVFIAGADLKAIQELDDAQLDAYLVYGSRVFGMFSELPFPTAAAINGAALGGGLELAMHCDAIIAAAPRSRDGQPGKPYPVGLPEAGLKICPGWGGTNLLAARMEPKRAIELTMTGTPMLVDDARAAGVFDRFSENAADLMTTAKQWVAEAAGKPRPARDGAPLNWIGRTGGEAFTGRRGVTKAALEALHALTISESGGGSCAAVLDAVNAGLTKGWQAALASERSHLIQLRNTPQGREAISAFFAKAGVKK